MIKLETFIECMDAIYQQDQFDQKLTDLIVDKESGGWCSTGENLIQCMRYLLKDIMDDKFEVIDWWLYEAPENEKFVYEDYPHSSDKQVRFNLNNLKDLYYYILGQNKEVKYDIVDKDTKNVSNSEFSDIGIIIDMFGHWR